LTDKEIRDSVADGAGDAEFFSNLKAMTAGHLQDTREEGRNGNEETTPDGPIEEDDQ
jgi:hypothetical protein